MPVPSGFRLLVKLKNISFDSTDGLNYILAPYPVRLTGTPSESLYWTSKSIVVPCSIYIGYLPADIFCYKYGKTTKEPI